MYETDTLLGLQYKALYVLLRVWRPEMRRWDCRAIARGMHPGCRTPVPRLEDEGMRSGEQGS